jgi:hypothetical protein
MLSNASTTRMQGADPEFLRKLGKLKEHPARGPVGLVAEPTTTTKDTHVAVPKEWLL